jgi:hypothetical protein
MELSGDELAGIVDQFDGLTEPALQSAIHEAAFRAGADLDVETIDSWIDEAHAEFTLLSVELDDGEYVVPGPRAFPTVPEMATDLPHVLDVEPVEIPEDTIERGIRNELAAAASRVEDSDRAHELIDVTYDAEAWAGTDLSDVRDRLRAITAEQDS